MMSANYGKMKNGFFDRATSLLVCPSRRSNRFGPAHFSPV
jgi:hypothetical protein